MTSLPFVLTASDAMPDAWVHWASVVGVVGGIIAILVVVVKMAQWLDKRQEARTIATVRKITQTNGGDSLRDDVKRAVQVGTEAAALGRANADTLHAQNEVLDGLRTDLAEHIEEAAVIVASSNKSREAFEQHLRDHEAGDA